jgi:hypothetical protein
MTQHTGSHEWHRDAMEDDPDEEEDEEERLLLGIGERGKRR